MVERDSILAIDIVLVRGGPISAQEFLERLFGDLRGLIVMKTHCVPHGVIPRTERDYFSSLENVVMMMKS